VGQVLHSNVLWVALGGAAGSVARYLLARAVQSGVGGSFPYGTLTVNVAGCLAIGFLSIRLESSLLAAHHRLAILVGLLGGFTTFSTFSYETLTMLERRQWLHGLANVLTSVTVCLAACWLGQRIARGLAT
jgi:CrcB protein